MLHRTIVVIDSRQRTRVFQVADIDVPLYKTYLKDVKSPNLVFADSRIIHTGIFSAADTLRWFKTLAHDRPQLPLSI